MRHLVVFICLLASPRLHAQSAQPIPLTQSALDSVGRKVWFNECGGTVSGLTSWNQGEQFASLGIGHFIWYPPGQRGPFEESFPRLAAYLAACGVPVPNWVSGPCPWPSRAAFQAAQDTPRMRQLRALLTATFSLQARFLADRMRASLPRMLDGLPPAQADLVRRNFQRLQASGPGLFALIDYVNFKGEGTLPTERYHGQGWGLLQVLLAMPPAGPDPVAGFSAAAGAVLQRRVRNAPPARHEERWLPGWINRVSRYSAS